MAYSCRVLTGALRHHFQRLLQPIGSGLAKLGVSPDTITLIGTLGIVASSIGLVARGYILAGALVITFFAFADMLDGAIARATNRTSKWGSFLDSTADRVADGAIFAAIAYWLATEHRYSAVAAAVLCLLGGAMVSYARAKAEALGLRGDAGFAERSERLILIGVGAVISQGWPVAMDVTLWLLAALAALTTVQRVLSVRRQLAEAPGTA